MNSIAISPTLPFAPELKGVVIACPRKFTLSYKARLIVLCIARYDSGQHENRFDNCFLVRSVCSGWDALDWNLGRQPGTSLREPGADAGEQAVVLEPDDSRNCTHQRRW